jgi:hypothetical protein
VCATLSLVIAGCHESARVEDSGRDGAAADVAEPQAPDANVATLVESMPGHGNLAQDTTPKRGPRMMPVETYIRSYMQLFGGRAPLAIQTQIRARDTGLFDAWNDYLASMGLPDHRVDIARVNQTSAIMLATLERTGIALCDLAVARELDAMTPPVANRTVFAFDLPAGALDRAAFATRFDVLHRTFLGYPSALAPDNREQRFFDLYTRSVNRYTAAMGAPSTLFRVKSNTGWAAVCYALVRHPEVQLYCDEYLGTENADRTLSAVLRTGGAASFAHALGLARVVRRRDRARDALDGPRVDQHKRDVAGQRDAHRWDDGRSVGAVDRRSEALRRRQRNADARGDLACHDAAHLRGLVRALPRPRADLAQPLDLRGMGRQPRRDRHVRGSANGLADAAGQLDRHGAAHGHRRVGHDALSTGVEWVL